MAAVWKFLDAMPPHYTAVELAPHEKIKIDGRLDDAAWQGVAWTTDFVDITRHAVPAMNQVPTSLQTRAKLRWDASFLYLGVELREPFVTANITGHNTGSGPPYHDNDFEAFFDVSGTTQYYKEFEMSALNATYDVLWGVPDGESLACAKNHANASAQRLPVCVNTSFPGYAGTWTMGGGGGGGLQTATYSADFGKYVSPYGVWTAEMAFPMRRGNSTAKHGGLLDAGPPYAGGTFEGTAADPSSTSSSGGGGPVYWHFDLARAEHPRLYTPPPSTTTSPSASPVFCPLNCSSTLSSWRPQLSAPNKAQCAAVKAEWPTLLGVDPWSCYWEWVLADVGYENAYMHRPLHWATLQMAKASKPSTCGQIEWPGRYIARLIYVAQRGLFKMSGAYTNNTAELSSACALVQGCAESYDDLHYALYGAPSIFNVSLNVTAGAALPSGGSSSHTSSTLVARPRFAASVRVAVPSTTVNEQMVQEIGSSFTYTVSIDSNSQLVTTYEAAAAPRPCLFHSKRMALSRVSWAA